MRPAGIAPFGRAVGDDGDMSDPGTRCPDEIADAVLAAGKFRIYLGAVAGVGKTIAMLDEGRRHKRGRDVVIGFVETHGRAHTAAEIGTLEVVP